MHRAGLIPLMAAAALILGCNDGTSPDSKLAPRTFRMGFSAIPPDSTQALTLASTVQ